MNRRLLLTVGLVLADFILLVLVFLLAYWLRFKLAFLPERPIEPFDLYFRLSFLVAFFGSVMLYTSRAYDLNQIFGLDQCFAVVRALTLSSLSLMVVVYVLRGYVSPHDTHLYSRLIIGFSWITSIVAMILWRWSFGRMLSYVRANGKGLRRVLLLGTDETTYRLYTEMMQQPALGYRLVGCLTDTGTLAESEDVRVLGNLFSLSEVLKTERVDEVILGISHLKSDLVVMLMNACQRADIKFSMVPSLFEILTSRTQTREIAGIPIFSVEEPLLRTWNRRVKRGIDLVIGGATALVTFPLWMFVTIVIKLESPGPILFRQKRMGKGEKNFDMVKFRSMDIDAEKRRKEVEEHNEVDGPIFKIRNDPRMTKVGRWIRRWSIDELPQLINVIKGEMSLVGPRPYPIGESEQFDTFERIRYDVLPGITGLAQVSGRSDLTIEEILRLDLYYIENWSIALDLKILLKTIPAVLMRRGAY